MVVITAVITLNIREQMFFRTDVPSCLFVCFFQGKEKSADARKKSTNQICGLNALSTVPQSKYLKICALTQQGPAYVSSTITSVDEPITLETSSNIFVPATSNALLCSRGVTSRRLSEPRGIWIHRISCRLQGTISTYQIVTVCVCVRACGVCVFVMN